MKSLVAVLAAAFAAAALLHGPSALARAGYCEIEVVNASQHDLVVHGTFDDGSPLRAFKMEAHGAPQYINLHYHGYCHAGMRLRVEGVPSRAVMYDAWTRVDATVRIVAH